MNRAEPPPSLSQAAFREIMACFPTGVAVVTAHAEGEPKGLTVSSFCAVSLSPPMVLVCVDQTSQTLPALREAGGFTVNFLSLGRHELAARFASKAEGKFEGVNWELPGLPQGGPVLIDDVNAYAVCVTTEAFAAGDHWIFLGEVREGAVSAEVAPLVYHRRSYVALGGTTPPSTEGSQTGRR
ncbi:MAG TPA: flavin reductase family protein [Candidatus Dormibacteraeota bacterium]|jgi:flavin reductase (DIM6/NTAB) family NADH-FMN oxidoreductase RutF|nr:flavin reductase family protein [Candidatus Dormibacteraeota bacterium]